MYTAVPLWWPALNDALLSVIAAKGATVRLLVSKWNHTNSLMLPNLAALQAAAAAVCPRGGRCPSSARDNRENGGGSLEVPSSRYQVGMRPRVSVRPIRHTLA